MSRRGMKIKTILFWNLLFMDAFVLHFRYGGMAVGDLIFHGICLGLATLLLVSHKRTYPIPKWIPILFTSVIVLVLLQLAPLPQFLFPILAPIKHRVLTTITGIYPEIPYTTQISILPIVAPIRIITLLMDMYLIILAIMAPRPKASLYRFWLVAISLTTASLAIVTSTETTYDSGLHHLYKGTFGGLVNPNNFAALANILMALLLGQVVVSLREAWIQMRSPGESDSRNLLKKIIFSLFYLFCYLHTFFGFQTVKSRSGVLGFIMVHLIMGLFLFFEMGSLKARFFSPKRLGLALAFLVLVGGVASFLPINKGLLELQDQGLQSINRVHFLRIGIDYIKEFPVLGAGLGASECILEAVQPKVYHHMGNARHLHNEYLQYAIELGLPGIVALLLFMGLVGRSLIPGLSLPSFEERVFFMALCSSLMFLAALCLISFPLRITSIRVLVLLVTFLGYKMASNDHRQANPRAFLAMISTILIACLAWLIPTFRYKPAEGGDMEQIAYTIRYGRAYKEHFFVANDKLGKFFQSARFSEEHRDELEEIQREIYKSLEYQQFNIKALNVLFLTDALLDKLDHPEYDQARYEALRHKAQVINDLGQGANVNSQSALLFIYGMYEEHLNEADRQAYDELKEAYSWNLRTAKKRIKKREQEANTGVE